MKMWQKALRIVLAAVLAFAVIWRYPQDEKECCLCNCFRYHAPCLLDLKTGELIELDVYMPHPTKVAELAKEQPQMDTFSFVKLGDAMGIKRTDSRRIVVDIPVLQRTINPALCKACRAQTGGVLVGRYVLADVYDTEEKTLIPLHTNLAEVIRCYEITAQKSDAEVIQITIQGILE